jgi:hypothetical protein
MAKKVDMEKLVEPKLVLQTNASVSENDIERVTKKYKFYAIGQGAYSTFVKASNKIEK